MHAELLVMLDAKIGASTMLSVCCGCLYAKIGNGTYKPHLPLKLTIDPLGT
jgi:hypothetical protein